jgi:hypothetical protein
MVCLELGLPPDLAELGRAAGRSLTRGDYLRLRAAGLGTVAAVADADSRTLEQALGRSSAVSPLHDAVRRHQEREEEKRQLRALLETEAA